MDGARRDLLLGAAALGLVGCQSKPEANPSALASSAPIRTPDALETWLRANVIAVRSVDASDEDFSDLEPLAQRIGHARIVQLGEPSHGAGVCFEAKVRLIKFLHQRMGFDVLAWESGFNDAEYTEAGLRAGQDAVASAKRGILAIWSASEQCRPLFEYAKASHAGGRPLIMAGFDMQFSGPGGFDLLPDELRSFVGSVRDPALRSEASQAAGDAIDAFSGFNAYVNALATRAATKPPPPRRDGLEKLQQAVAQLTKLFNDHPAAFAEIGGERRFSFMAHVVANLGGYGANLYEKYSVDDPAGPFPQVVASNRRDALMAENIRWLVETGYPGHKFIIWAHNAHVMNAYYKAPDFTNISLAPAPDAMKPFGVFLAERFGDDVYTIGCTAYQGEDALIASPMVTVPSARDGGLEERLHRLGHPFALADLRSARDVAGHPLKRPQIMRVPKYDEIEVADVTAPYDAIFYVDRMKPATLIR